MLQKYALVILVEFLCFKYYDDTVRKNYVTYKKEMKFDDFVQLPAFKAQKKCSFTGRKHFELIH